MSIDIIYTIYMIYLYNSYMVYIYIYIWVNYNDLTVLPHWNHDYKGNHPQVAEQIRLVKYYNLPRYIFLFFWLMF